MSNEIYTTEYMTKGGPRKKKKRSETESAIASSEVNTGSFHKFFTQGLIHKLEK